MLSLVNSSIFCSFLSVTSINYILHCSVGTARALAREKYLRTDGRWFPKPCSSVGIARLRSVCDCLKGASKTEAIDLTSATAIRLGL